MFAETNEIVVRKDGVFRGGTYIPFPEKILREHSLNQSIIGNKFYMNGYELMDDNTFKRTFKALFYMLF